MFLNINRDGADDSRIFDDLRNMSHGSIRLDPASTVLNDYRPTPLQAGKRKRRNDCALAAGSNRHLSENPRH